MEYEMIEHKSCWVSTIPQGTQEWLQLRYGGISSSNISRCVGRSPYWGKTKNDLDRLGRILCGIEIEEFSEQAKIHMSRGTKYEDSVRQIHNNYLINVVKMLEYGKIKKYLYIDEMGLAIWKKDPRIRGSLDGEIGDDGCAEYKVPVMMYKPLIQYIEAKVKGYNTNGFDHIHQYHYDQMTLNSIITDKKWCDYCVMCGQTDRFFYQRINTDYELWDTVLYPKACEFYNNHMLKIVENNPLLIFDINRYKTKKLN